MDKSNEVIDALCNISESIRFLSGENEGGDGLCTVEYLERALLEAADRIADSIHALARSIVGAAHRAVQVTDGATGAIIESIDRAAKTIADEMPV
jgi:hypothetical protein